MHASSATPQYVDVHTPVRGFTRSRARNVLKRTMNEAGANSAHLYVLGPDSATLTASAGADAPPSQIAVEAWPLGTHDAGDNQAESKLRIRTINALERTYELSDRIEDPQAHLCGVRTFSHHVELELNPRSTERGQAA